MGKAPYGVGFFSTFGKCSFYSREKWRKMLTKTGKWDKICHTTMAEVAVFKSMLRFGNCRTQKGTTAEEKVRCQTAFSGAAQNMRRTVIRHRMEC